MIEKKEIVSEKKKKPQYDEQVLSNLLEAAYVLQEHNLRKRESASAQEPRSTGPEKSGLNPVSPTRETAWAELDTAAAAAMERAGGLSSALESAAPLESAKDDYTPTLAQIVETQHQIQIQRLGLKNALALVAEHVMEIARAGGAGIGIIKDSKVVYDAVVGQMTLPLGKEVAAEKALCSASLRTGHVIRSTHVNADFLIDGEECRRRGIHSLIVVPVYHTGGVGGALELYYAGGQSFTEADVHTGQLMAGLITEALARAEEENWKKSLESERAVMLEALEKLKPNLAALVDASAKSAPSVAPKVPELAVTAESASSSPAEASTFICRKCGHSLVGEEQFCGNCGLPRGGEYEPPNMQSKVASLWHMQEAMKKKSAMESPVQSGDEVPEESLGSLTDSLAAAGIWKDLPADSDEADGKRERDEGDDAALAKDESVARDSEKAVDWSSAASARDFLEQLARPGALARFWNSRRGDIYLAIAVVLVVCVIRWGIWSDHPVGASGAAGAAHSQPAPEPNLSLFDRMLISLGLAEAPDPPEFKGNPQTQVWVDLQTGLYYCSGADLYNNTPKGRFESQREAQLDQFQPASRKACN